MPIVTHASVSQITEYALCGRKWYYRKVARIKQPPSVSLVFGRGLHRALQTFNEQWAADKSNIDREEVLKVLFKYLDDELTYEILEVEHKAEKKKKKATKALKAMTTQEYVETKTAELKKLGADLITSYMDRDDHGDEILAIETWKESVVKGVKLIWIPDLLDRYNGKLRLTDYKTKARSDDKVAAFQLSIYCHLIQEELGEKVEIVRQLNFIKNPKKARIEELPYDTDDLDKDVPIFYEELNEFLKGTKAEVYPRNKNMMCGICDFEAQCWSGSIEQQTLEVQDEVQVQDDDEGTGLHLI